MNLPKRLLYQVGLTVLGIAVFDHPAAAQTTGEPTLHGKLQETQRYAEKDRFIYPLQKPWALPQGGSLTIQYDPQSGFPVSLLMAKKDQQKQIQLVRANFRDRKSVAISNSGKLFAHLVSDGVAVVSLEEGSIIQCNGEFPLENTNLIASGNKFLSTWRDGDKLRIFEHVVAPDQTCVSKPLATIAVPKQNLNFYAAADQGHLNLVIADSQKGVPDVGRDFVRYVSIDVATGNKITDKKIEGYKLSSSGESFGANSVSPKGTLISLTKTNDPLERVNLHLIDSKGNQRKIAEGGIDGLWTDSGDILVNYGRGAQSSDLALLKGPGFKQKINLPQDEGYKANIEISGDNISYINRSRTQPYELISLNTDGTSLKKESAIKDPSKRIELPPSKKVEYIADGRKIPGFLHGCKEGAKKLPAIVYAHGSNAIGTGGDRMTFNSGEALMMAQAGFVVLEASYQGDSYLGREYTRDPITFSEHDFKTHALDDLNAAGLYAKNLPCVDPTKVIYFGHSEGAYTGALLATDKARLTQSPFTAFVLRAGVYNQQEIEDTWEFTQKHRLAVEGTDEDRYTEIKHSSPYDCLKVYEPKQEIVGVDNALKVLAELKKTDKDLYGVTYTTPESFYDRIVPLRRVTQVGPSPIYLMHGTDDDPEGAGTYEFERKLRTQGAHVTSWYPEGQGHIFEGEPQVEMVERLVKFSKSLK